MEKLPRHIVKKTSISDMDDDGYVPGTPEYRIGIVWDITRDTWAFVKKVDAERRLQRDVTKMIKAINKKTLSELSPADDLSWWLSRPPEERIEAVEILRRQYHGTSERLQRVARIIERP